MPAFVSACAGVPNRVAEGPRWTVQSDLEYIHSWVDTEENDTGDETDTEFDYFKQKYNVEVRNEVFPYLNALGGTQIELIDSSTVTDGIDTGFKQRMVHAYGELDLNNPLYRLGTAYRRREFTFSPNNVSKTRVSREEVSGIFKWRPDGFPSIDLDYNRFHTWDANDTRDLTVGLLVLKSRYNYEDFLADYTYTRSDQEEKFIGNESVTQIHNGGMRHIEEFFQDRLEVSGSARFNYQNLAFAGDGDIRLPTASPGAEFYLLDDSDPSTLTIVDAANPLTNVNIGRNAPLIPVGVGLDFGPPTEVDTIHVLPLEDLTDPTIASPGEIAAVAGAFVWTVFTSDDQLNWVERTVTSATYSVFENRFEITFFPNVDTEFIKVVTTPIPTATGEIRIEQLQAFATVTVEGKPDLTLENFTQTYNFGLRWRFNDRTRASYESFVRVREDKPFDRKKTTLTNGFTLEHEINPILFADARVLRTDTLESIRDNMARHTYSASLTADWLPTLNQRLIYSGEHINDGGRTDYTNSIFLRTNADIYRDWGVNLDAGFSAKSPALGKDSTSTSFRLGTNVAPNERMNFTIDYLGSWDTETDRPSSYNQIARFQAFWVPIPTFSVYAGVSLRDQQRDQSGLKVNQNYSVNWSPFQDGALTFNLAYNQTIDTRDNEVRALTPEINWQMTRTSLLTLSFDYGTIETDANTRDLKVIRTRFRTFF